MDIGDWFALFPIGPSGPPGRGRSAEDQAASAIGMALFPLVAFVLVLFTGLWKHTTIALVALPVLFAALSVLVCRLLRVGGGWTVVVALGSGVACAVAAGIAFLLGVFGSFFSGF